MAAPVKLRQIGPGIYITVAPTKPKAKAKRPRLPRVGFSECGAGSVPMLTREMLDAYKAAKAKGSK